MRVISTPRGLNPHETAAWNGSRGVVRTPHLQPPRTMATVGFPGDRVSAKAGANRQSHICLLVLCGLPGAGKTTLAEHLVRAVAVKNAQSPLIHAVHCRFDDYLPQRVDGEKVGSKWGLLLQRSYRPHNGGAPHHHPEAFRPHHINNDELLTSTESLTPPEPLLNRRKSGNKPDAASCNGWSRALLSG